MGRTLAIMAGSALILMFATLLLVVAPYFQLAVVQPAQELKPYSESQLAGRELYVSLGCVYCHSQQPRDPSQAPDMQRGWGRPSAPSDYVYDTPHLLGTMRTGPDLLNIGARQPSRDWHLAHLYQPRAVSPGSIMPAYPFLFDVTDVVSPDAVTVKLPPDYAPVNRAIVAKPSALALVDYLLALDRTYPTQALPSVDSDQGVGDG